MKKSLQSIKLECIVTVFFSMYLQGFLDIKMKQWLRNLMTRSIAIVPSLIVSIIGGSSGAGRLIVIASVQSFTTNENISLPIRTLIKKNCHTINHLLIFSIISKLFANRNASFFKKWTVCNLLYLIPSDHTVKKNQNLMLVLVWLLRFIQMILSFELPFALIPLLKFSSSSNKMGENKNSIYVSTPINQSILLSSLSTHRKQKQKKILEN